MHRDIKLGLSLAVLLIGSTTAFFFRNDSDRDSGLPQLKDPARLDGTIAERDVAPYLLPLEPQPPTATTQSAIEADLKSPWIKPQFLTGSESIVSITPDPIPLHSTTQSNETPTPITRHVEEVTSLPHSGSGELIHIVEPGDTLGAIAARHLGTIARYREIFELNRDVLKGPDDLQIGMKLRLPPRSQDTSSSKSLLVQTETPSPSEGSVHEPTTAPVAPDVHKAEPPAATAAKMFVPVRRTPFLQARFRNLPAQDDAE